MVDAARPARLQQHRLHRLTVGVGRRVAGHAGAAALRAGVGLGVGVGAGAAAGLRVGADGRRRHERLAEGAGPGRHRRPRGSQPALLLSRLDLLTIAVLLDAAELGRALAALKRRPVVCAAAGEHHLPGRRARVQDAHHRQTGVLPQLLLLPELDERLVEFLGEQALHQARLGLGGAEHGVTAQLRLHLAALVPVYPAEQLWTKEKSVSITAVPNLINWRSAMPSPRDPARWLNGEKFARVHEKAVCQTCQTGT